MQNNNFYSVLFILAVVYLLLDWYVFQGIKALTADWSNVLVRRSVHVLFWLAFVGMVAAVAYAFMTVRAAGGWTPFSKLVFNTFLILFVTKLVFIIVLFGEDVYRAGAAVVQLVYPQNNGEGWVPSRRKFVSQAGLVLASIPFFSLLYGITKGKYDYRVHKQTLYFDDLPESFDGFRIVQISDIHSGSFDDPVAVQKGIDLVKQQQGDLLVFTGDLVNNNAGEIEPWIPAFSQLKAPYGQFSILGNHDYGDYSAWNNAQEKITNFDTLKRHHATLGYRLLLDENVRIQKDGQQISLLGVENWGVGFGKRGDLNKALSGVQDQDFKILLSHDPSHWDAEVKNHPANMHLTLSGHTHGMQFGVEIPGLKWSPVQYRYPNWAGLAQENNRYLYVNRGFGFHGFSGRVGIWPEVTVLTLKKKTG